MYEQTGRYYALFGPHASITSDEERFIGHWAAGRKRALDIGAGLCGSATLLARFGLDVIAFEPSPVLAALAMDRLNRGDETARKVTLVEGDIAEFAEPFLADVILLRSVLMLLDDDQRSAALDAARRHAAPDARLIVDVRTAALPWADSGGLTEERSLGRTTYRRRTAYAREPGDVTRVEWSVEALRFGRTYAVAAESFHVRADTPAGLRDLLRKHDFEVEQLYGAYDLHRSFNDGDAMLIAVARRG